MKYKVVKRARNAQGEWFDMGAAFSGTKAACEKYAAAFLAEQITPTPMGGSLAGHLGLQITIRDGKGAIVKVYHY